MVHKNLMNKLIEDLEASASSITKNRHIALTMDSASIPEV
jgi:hypothetical protein